MKYRPSAGRGSPSETFVILAKGEGKMNPELQRDMQAFGSKMVGIYGGAALTQMIHIGYVTGLFESAAQGPATTPN